MAATYQLSASSVGPDLTRAYGSDERGSVGVVFAIACMVVMAVIAAAVEFGQAGNEQQRMQRAVDAAALAASDRLGLPDQDATGEDIAKRFFNVNVGGRPHESVKSVVLDASKGEVNVEAGASLPTSFLNIFRQPTIAVNVGTRIAKGSGTVEVALVLDNSGSMAGQPITDLITAATNLVNVVFTGADESQRVKVAVVPFSGAVNVGGDMTSASWIDTTGLAPFNGANFASNIPRLEMFNKLGVAWKGCVEARPSPHDVTLTTPDANQPETLFVPMFAPDEPDRVNAGGASYSNSYLVDDGGSCTPQPRECTSYSRRGNCTNWTTTPLPTAEAQARICKYEGASIASGVAGPNYMCDSESLLRLEATKSQIESKLATMVAKGSTNIAEGLMWGWRSLAPGAPLNDGRPYGTEGNEKIIVLMTDGANTYSAYSNHNKSWYGAHGYGSSGRLGTTYTSSGFVSQMDAKTLAACNNVKAAGIKLYTVAFRLDAEPAAQALLKSCASEPPMAFKAGDGTALIGVFEKIGTSISRLRVAG